MLADRGMLAGKALASHLEWLATWNGWPLGLEWAPLGPQWAPWNLNGCPLEI
jgi:hypothetical protein